MAKVLKKGTIPSPIGLKGRCPGCECEFELEEGDIAVWVSEERAYRSRCPGCAADVRVSVPRNGGVAMDLARVFVEKAKAERGRG
jgi:hypothetical protein